MTNRLRPWVPVLAVALGLALLSWLVASAALAGHRLVRPDLPAGVPSEAARYLPDEVLSEFPEDVDLAEDSAADLPPELLADLEQSLSTEELAQLAGVLSDDLLVELARKYAHIASGDDLEDLYDNADPATRDRLLDAFADELTQSELDTLEGELPPQVYEELQDRADASAPGPGDDEPTSEPGDEQPTSEPDPGDSAEPSSPSPTPDLATQEPSGDEARDDDAAARPWWQALGDYAAVVTKWLLIGAAAALAAFLVSRLAVVLFGSRSRSSANVPTMPADTEQPEVDKLREAVQEGIDDLDDAADPRRGVIACWQRLERAAAAAGLERRSAETPGELVARVLAAARVDDAALTELAECYRRARYGPHRIGEETRQRAKAALTTVDAQLSQLDKVMT